MPPDKKEFINQVMSNIPVVGQIYSGFAQGAQNRKSREFSREMYDRQYQDSIKFWNMQNEYNSPQEQRKRLEAANLNPALMYKGGAGQGMAGNIKTPDVQSAQFRTADMTGLGLGRMNYLNQIYDMDVKQAQADNMKKQGNLILAETGLKIAQRMSTVQGTRKSKFELELAQELRQNSLDVAVETLRGITSRNDILLNEEERNKVIHGFNIQNSIEDILSKRLGRAKTRQEISNLKEMIKKIKADTSLAWLDHKLGKQGYSRSDPMYMRQIGLHLDTILGGNLMNKLAEKGKEWKFKWPWKK